MGHSIYMKALQAEGEDLMKKKKEYHHPDDKNERENGKTRDFTQKWRKGGKAINDR